MRPSESALPFPPPAAPDARASSPRRLGDALVGLARAVDLATDTPVCVALSGGADSVYLLHLLAAARPRPRVWAVHVEHGLRGAASRADAAFCVELARSLDVPLVRERAPLDAQEGDLEQRARFARYRALCRAAELLRRAHARHRTPRGRFARVAAPALDARRRRGGVRRRSPAHAARRPRCAEPDRARGARRAAALRAARREEVRATLARAGLAWREDESNDGARFARNRVRHALLPALRATCGDEVDDHLRAFATAVEELERHCARWTAGVRWQAPLFASARAGRFARRQPATRRDRSARRAAAATRAVATAARRNRARAQGGAALARARAARAPRPARSRSPGAGA